MKRASAYMVLCGIAVVMVILCSSRLKGDGPQTGNGMASKVQRGFELAPVHLNMKGKNPALVGLGSYIVNAQGACNDCHTCPSYAPGHSPYEGGDGKINSDNYLAGGVPMNPFVTSKNITPDANGKPAGLTRDEFMNLIRTGVDPDTKKVLQVMPWPIYRNMSDHELLAIYEYLSAIPSATPGACAFPGQ